MTTTTRRRAVLGPAALGRAALCALALASLLLPPNILGGIANPLLFGVPLVLTAIRQRGTDARDFRLWALYTFAFVTFVYCWLAADDLARMAGRPTGVHWVIALDRVLGFGELPTIRLQRALYTFGHPSALVWAALSVYMMHFVVGPLAGAFLWATHRDRFPRYLVSMSVIGFVALPLFILCPTAPPWLASAWGQAPPVYRIVADALYHVAPRFYALGLERAGGNAVAAFPSLHLGFAWTVALACRSHPRRWGRVVGWAYVVGMSFALVFLGEHYVVDELAGIALATAVWWAVGRALSRARVPHLSLAPEIAPHVQPTA